MTSADLTHLHPDDIPLWLGVEAAVWRLALAAKLNLKLVRPVPKRSLRKIAGYCMAYPHNEIQIALRQTWEKKNGWGKRYALHQILDTIPHEVAHLSAGFAVGHGAKFFREFARWIVLAEDIGIRVDILNSETILES